MVYRDGKAQSLSVTIALRERHEFDMGPMLFRGDGEHEPLVFQMDPEKMQELREMRRDRTLMPRGRSPRELELEKRLAELEKRLAELEKQLQKK
jgi:hypothetical protein